MSRIALSAPQVCDEEIDRVVQVLRSGRLAQGAEVEAFETEFADLVDGRHCVAVSSGTAALLLSLLALGIGRGDEVIAPSFTFGGTINPVALVGATPVFADIDPVTYCLDPGHVRSLITPRTRAILPVHLFGHPAAMPELLALARRHGLAVVEDAAQAVAATLAAHPVGAFGDTACFSFYPTKNMHTIEGGMIATADSGLAQRLRMLRNQGMSTPYRYEIVGLNARMSEVSAAIGRVQLRRLAAVTATRRANAARLSAALATGRAPVVPPVAAAGAGHVFHQYVVRVPSGRDLLARRLADAGITTAVHYRAPVHRSPAHRQPVSLPQTDLAAGQVLSLPVHPGLSDRDLDRVAAAVTSA